MSYNKDRAYGDRFMAIIKGIIGPHLLCPSPFEIDTTRASDLIVLRAEALDIGVRIRRPGYGDRWPHDFTIRAKRDSGAKTELEKVCNGWMHWMFYGHGSAEDQAPALVHWMLVDMRVWRREIMRAGWPEAKRRGLVTERSNSDGTHFVACDVRKYPNDLLIAANLPMRVAA